MNVGCAKCFMSVSIEEPFYISNNIFVLHIFPNIHMLSDVISIRTHTYIINFIAKIN